MSIDQAAAEWSAQSSVRREGRETTIHGRGSVVRSREVGCGADFYLRTFRTEHCAGHFEYARSSAGDASFLSLAGGEEVEEDVLDGSVGRGPVILDALALAGVADEVAVDV